MAEDGEEKTSEEEKVEAPTEPTTGSTEESEAVTSEDTDDGIDSDDVFSLEDLDKIIEEEDPEFAESLDEIASNDELNSADIESLDVSEAEEIIEEEEEKQPSKLHTKIIQPIKGKINKVVAPIKKVTALIAKPFKKPISFFKEYIKNKKQAIRNRIILMWSDFKVFLKQGLPDRLKYLKKVLTEKIKKIILWILSFKELSLKKKITSILLIPAVLATTYLVVLTLQKQWLPMIYQPLFVGFHTQATTSYEYKIDDFVELFKHFPQKEFAVELPKIVFNLRRLPTSGPTPMGTYQIYVVLDSQDTAIEVKDREREIMSIMRSVSEGFTYEDLNTNKGKKRLQSALRFEINEILNQGRIKQVYFKIIIIKP